MIGSLISEKGVISPTSLVFFRASLVPPHYMQDDATGDETLQCDTSAVRLILLKSTHV